MRADYLIGSRHETDEHVTETLLPEYGFAQDAVARVQFDSRLTPTLRGQWTGAVDNAGVGFRHRWGMDVWNWSNRETLATAQQHFVIGGMSQDLDVLSRWNITGSEDGLIPTWVMAFLSVLDDIEEEFGQR